MKIVIAPDSFKESLSAIEVATQVGIGFREIFPDGTYLKLPVADGGEGTVNIYVEATGGKTVTAKVTGPLGKRVNARYGILGDGETAVIEMSSASGLSRVPPEKRNPLITTSFGTGELIRHALDAGFRCFVIGLGGSVTNDFGAGLLQVLGVRLLGRNECNVGFGGAAMERIHRIDASGLDARLSDCSFQAACDVDNPLLAEKGASAVFGPQKGATPEMVEQLDRNLSHFAAIVSREVGKDMADLPGAGAAGGLGAALTAFLNATLCNGFDVLTQNLGIENAISDADLVATGEGCLDHQTIQGKAPIGVARMAKCHAVPVIAIAGSLPSGTRGVFECGIDAAFGAVSMVCSLDEALREARNNFRTTARNIAAVINLTKRHMTSRPCADTQTS